MGSQLPSVGLTVPVDHKAGAAYLVLMGGKTTSSDNRALLGLVAFIVFIDMMGIGLIMPVMPALIMGIAKVSVDRAAEIGGLLFFAYAFMQFLFAPVIGGLSDRFGRRPVLLLTLTALGIDYAFHGLGAYADLAFCRADHCRCNGGYMGRCEQLHRRYR